MFRNKDLVFMVLLIVWVMFIRSAPSLLRRIGCRSIGATAGDLQVTIGLGED